MSRTFKQLTDGQRYQIHALLEAGMLQKDIAEQLDVNASTITREKKRRAKRDGTYDANLAVHKAKVKRGNAKWTGMKIEKYPELRQHIIDELKDGQSPECIAGRMKTEQRIPRVSSDTIYQWLYSVRGVAYSPYLCTKRTNRKKRKQKKDVTLIPSRVSIHDRPKDGVHAEGDTFHSPKSVRSSACVSCIVRLDTKEISLQKASSQSPVVLARCFQKSVDQLTPDTVTFDNGLENRQHTTLSIPTYFCDPGSPKQKPLVESSIGLVRRWELPKGSNLFLETQTHLDEITEFFNNKYRKSLGYLSPREYRAKLDGD